MSTRQLPTGSDEVWAGRYQLRRLLGEGSRKRVYLARDTRLDRDVAVAVLRDDTLGPTGAARVQRETQTMARLGDHPHIVPIYDVSDEQGQPYIVTQLMAGGSLDDLLRTREHNGQRGLQLNEVLRLGDHICRALEHAHGHGVVHRDLKPANVWLTAEGNAKLGDFGLALARDRSRLTVEGMMVGTVAYMAPEQALGKTVDARSDLYSLGALLYELLTGRPPFVGDGAVAVVSQHLHTQPVAPSWHNASVPQPLEALILQLLEKEPEKRPISASAVRQALEHVGSDLDRLSAESRSQPTQSATLVSPSSPPAPNPLERLDAGVFVGREQETRTLRAAVEDALAGRSRMVLVAGEPGIGKTRLAQEAATYAQLRGMQVLWGRCHEGGGAPAYWPWVQVIRNYVHQRPAEELRDELGGGAPDIANIVSAVRERLPDLPPLMQLEPEEERFRLFDSITMFLKRAASHQALMLVVDDLHWADVPSLLLLQFLVRNMQSERLVVVATYRDEEAEPERPLFATLAALGRAPVTLRMTLAGLREPEISQLIERTTGDRPSEALVATVARQTEGNPFFVGEVVRWLTAQGQLAKAASAVTGVPPSVREVIVQRLQRLSPRCNELLASGAVVGRDFPLALLARMRGEPEDAVLELAEEAVAARVLTEVDPGRYSFTHALIRETLYAEPSPARRRRLHRQIGEALEALYATRLEAHLPALAHHFSEAASPETAEKAVAYARQAADRYMALTAYEDAVTYYERVLRAVDRGEQPDALQRAEVLLSLGLAEFGCGKPLEEVRARYHEAANIAREAGAPELLARAALEYSTGPTYAGAQDARRSQLLDEASEALAGHRTAVHARLLVRLAWDRADRGTPPEEIGALCEKAVAIARGLGDAVTLAHVLAQATRTEWRPETLSTRVAWLQELTGLSKRIADKRLDLDVHFAGIVVFGRLGDRASLDREIDAHAALAEELRLPFFLNKMHMTRCMRATISGRFAEAERCAKAGFESLRSLHPESAEYMARVQMWTLSRERGDRLGELEAPFRSMIERFPHNALRAGLAWLYTDLGRVEEARSEFERLAASDFTDLPKQALHWHGTIGMLAEVCAALGDTARAPVLYGMLEPFAAQGMMLGDPVCFGATTRHLGLLAATMRRWEDASRHFEHALTFNAALGAPPLVARTQYGYAAMLLSRGAPGDRRRALELLTPAVETARALGMKLLLESALALKLRAQGSETIDVRTSIDLVAAEVSETRPDLGPHAAPDGTLTFFFSDIEGFAAMTERLGERRAHAVLDAHNRIIREQLARHGGVEVKSQGDGFMMTFQSARRAVLCAIAVQRALTGHAAEHPEEPIRIRIGLHTGDAFNDAGDSCGSAVNVTARIAGAARGGEILVSSVLRDLTAGVNEVRYGPGRPVTLKGVSGPRTVFSVLWGGEPRDDLSAAAAASPDTAVLRHEGAYWTLTYAGITGRLKDTRGLRYLAHLLRHPGREFHVIDLARQVGGQPAAEHEQAPVAGQAGLEVLDESAKSAYRRRLAELRDDLEEAERFNDTGRSERAREEMEAITAELASAVGLGGRDRTSGATAERARSTVGRRIRDALRQIGDANPPLGDHIARRVKTGTFCSYLPDNARPLEWHL